MESPFQRVLNEIQTCVSQNTNGMNNLANYTGRKFYDLKREKFSNS